MMQTFLAALGTSQIVIGLSFFSPFARLSSTCQSGYESRSQGKLSILLGGSLLGAGMAMSGACPGTFYSQLGSGVPGSMYVLGGAMTGIAIFAFIEKLVAKHINHIWRNNKRLLHESFPYATVATGVAMIAASNAFKVALPNSMAPIGAYGMNAAAVQLAAWSAQAAGAMIGLWQIPSVLLLHHPMGMSSALTSVVAPLLYPLKAIGLIDPHADTMKSVSAFWTKAIFVGSVISGALISASLSGTLGTATGLISTTVSATTLPRVYPLFAGNGALQAFIGGVFLWLGARIGGGCTSGHGISGCSFFNLNSFLAVPAMFAGGILTSYLLNGMSF